MLDNQRIAGYAYRYWRRHHMEQWPTVRQAAASLNIRQGVIEETAGDGLFMLTGYNVQRIEFGGLRIEATIPEVERDWCAYWRPFSAGCCCGQHR